MVTARSTLAQCPNFDSSDVITVGPYNCESNGIECVCDPDAVASIVNLPNTPNRTLFGDMVGLNIGSEIDQLIDGSNPADMTLADLKAVADNVRYFHLMEKDYGFGKKCSNNAPIFGNTTPAASAQNFINYSVCPNGYDPTTPWDCWGTSYVLDAECNGTSSCAFKPFFASNQVRCAYLTDAELSVHATMEAFFLTEDCEGQAPGFPNKWFSREQWGGDLDVIQENANLWASNYLKSFCAGPDGPCAVDFLEVGNEPWGEPGQEAFQSILMGVIEAFCGYFGDDNPENWAIKLGGPSLQAFQDVPRFQFGNSDYVTGDNVNGMIPEGSGLAQYLSKIGVHPYSTEGCDNDMQGCSDFDFWTRPENATGEFLTGKHMAALVNECNSDSELAGLDLSVSEFGWNSDDIYHKPEWGSGCAGSLKLGVGRIAQAAYLARSIFMISSWGGTEAILYEAIDNPREQRFYSMGLLETETGNRKVTGKKPAYHVIKKFNSEPLAKLKFLKSYAETDQGLYLHLLGNENGEAQYLVAWNADDISPNQNSFNFNLQTIAAPNTLAGEMQLDFSRKPILMDDDDNQDYSIGDVVSFSGNSITAFHTSPIPILIPVKRELPVENDSCDCDFEISANVYAKICHDKGTPDPSDDFFTFVLDVDRNPPYSGDPDGYPGFWYTEGDLTTWGNYLFITDPLGAFTAPEINFTIYDYENPLCSLEMTVANPCVPNTGDDCGIEPKDCPPDTDFNIDFCNYSNEGCDPCDGGGTVCLMDGNNFANAYNVIWEIDDATSPNGWSNFHNGVCMYYSSTHVQQGRRFRAIIKSWDSKQEWQCVQCFDFGELCNGENIGRIQIPGTTETPSKMSVFPNPADKEITIYNDRDFEVIVSIIRIDGTVQSQHTLGTKDQKMIDVVDFAEGIYYLQFEHPTTSQIIHTENIVIAHSF